MSEILRLPAEELYKAELDALIANETNPVPAGWRMSPKSVLTYICGGKAGISEITPKYMGDKRIVEICIATLLTIIPRLCGRDGIGLSYRIVNI